VPIYKRGDVNVRGNYKGISLLCTAYKIYTEIIRKRLEEEVENKNMLPESQTGFRKRKSTLDNTFILNHLVQKGQDMDRRKGKVYAFFADLRTPFDNVNRGILWRTLREKGVDDGLIRKK